MGKFRSSGASGAVALLVLATLLPLPAAAQVWQGDVSADWADADNWSTKPSATVPAVINGGSPNTPVISTGAQSAQSVELGTAFGQTGTLSLTGGSLSVGAKPSNAFYSVAVGDQGHGILTISGGADLTSGYSYVGLNLDSLNNTRSSGVATVTGAGSSWVSTYLDIGSSGTGTLDVLLGASVSTGQLHLGSDTGASGTLTISGGSTLSSTVANIASFAGGSGGITVTGTGSVFTVTGAINVGKGTDPTVNGTLAVSAGGKAVSNSLVISSRGTVTLDGATSRIETGSVQVARLTGLTITNGGTLAATGNGTVSGSASLSGNSTWTMAALTVAGATGAGSLSILSGSDVSSTTGTISGNGTTGAVTVSGTGSSWNMTGALTMAVFSGATASLEITGGAEVSAASLVNTQAGTVTLSGTGSKLTVTGTAQFGGSGGTMTTMISAGADVVTGIIANETAPSMPTPTLVAAVAGGTSNVTLTGLGSSWTNYGVFSIASGGTGTVQVADQATLATTRLQVSGKGLGTLTVSGGATVTTRTLEIATDSTVSTGNGTVTVTGVGSKLTVTDTGTIVAATHVGRYGTGRLEVLNGGEVVAGYLETAGGNANGRGSILVSGAGSKLKTQAIDLGTFAGGVLTISNGGRVDATDRISVLKGTELIPGGIALDNGTLTTTNTIYLYGGTTLSAVNGSVIESDSALLAVFGAADVVVGLGGNTTSWTIARDLEVGNSGDAEMTLTGGADLTVGRSLVVGRLAGAEGTLIARGTGTTIRTTSTTSGPRIGGFAMAGGSGTLIVADGAALDMSGPATIFSTGLLQLGEGAAPGTLTGTALAVDGELRLNHTGNLALALPMSGAGSITKFGSGTATLTGTSTFSGTTTVNAGRLVVGDGTGGSLASSAITIASGATLGGVGGLGATSILAGGTHAPGNSIGSVTINGNYANAGTLVVELDDAGNADLLNVNGTVDVSQATLRLVPLAGSTFTVGQAYDYTLINNDGVDPVAPFATVEDLVFFTADLTYTAGDGNDVWLQLIRDNTASFAGLGTTPNQVATAEGLDSLPTSSLLYDALQFLTTGDADATLDQLSGEIHAHVAGLALDNSRLPREAALDRIAAAFAAIDQQNSPWLRMVGTIGTVSGDGNAAGASTATAGLLAGIDGWVGDNLFLGAEFGVTGTGLSLPDRNSTAELQSLHFGLYGGAELDQFRLRFGGAISAHQVEVERTPAVTGLDDTLSSSYGALTAQLFGEAGYVFELGDISVEPFAGIAFVHAGIDPYSETGSIAALSGEASSHSTTIATIGVRGSTDFDLAGRPAQLHLGVALQSAGADQPTATHRFADGEPFTVAGAPGGPVLNLEAGFSSALSDSSRLDLAYKGSLGRDSAGSAVTLTFSGKF